MAMLRSDLCVSLITLSDAEVTEEGESERRQRKVQG
jgi:hypothetical protein